MKTYRIEPEVAAELVGSTEFDRSQHPPLVSNIEVNFPGWMGDHLVTSFPCFFVTEQLKEKIVETGLTGCSFRDFKYEVGEDAPTEMGNFRFLQLVLGADENSDFRVDAKGDLVVTQAGLNVILSFAPKDCIVKEI